MTAVEHSGLTLEYLDRNGEVKTAIVAKSNPQFTWATGWGVTANKPVALRWDPSTYDWREVTKYGYVCTASNRMYPELKIIFEQQAHDVLDKSLPEGAVPFERGQQWREPPDQGFPYALLFEVWVLV